MTDKIGLDSNVALRWLVQDPSNLDQSLRAMSAIDAFDGPIHINLVVLAELVWLVSRTLKAGRAEQALLIRGLLEHPFVELADKAAVATALTLFEQGGAGFTDHLIAALNGGAGCATTLTFDKVAARGNDFTLLD